MRYLLVIIILLSTFIGKTQTNLVLKDFGNFKITMDKKNFYLSPSEKDTLFMMTEKKDLVIKNEVILLKRESGSEPYQFSTYYEYYNNLKYCKIIKNEKPETELTNPEFTQKNRAYLLANSDYIKRTKNWLVVNIPERVHIHRFGLHTSQGSDSLNESGDQVYQTEYTDEGGIFIYDIKNRKTLIDLNSKTMININKNGILLRKMNAKMDVEDIYSMMDWKGKLIFDNITYKQLLKDDEKLKLIAGNGDIKSIYGKKTAYLILDSNFIDNNLSGFHYVNNQNKCGYFSFSGYHLENSYDFLYFLENKLYTSKNNTLQIRQMINANLDTLAAEAKEDIQMFVEPNSGFITYFRDDKTKRSFDRNISFMKTNDEYIISIPLNIEEYVEPLIIMDDLNDPTTWNPAYDDDGNPIIKSYQYFINSIGKSLILDKKTGKAFEMDSVTIKYYNEDGWLFNQMEYKILDKGHEEINHYFAMDKKLTRKSDYYSDSVLWNHPEQIIQFILNDKFHYIGSKSAFYIYDYGIFYEYKNNFHVLGDFEKKFDFKNNQMELDQFKYNFKDKLTITDLQNYATDSVGKITYKQYELKYNEIKNYELREFNAYRKSFSLNNHNSFTINDEAIYFFKDSIAIINVFSKLWFPTTMVKPDPTDYSTWYDSLDANGVAVLNYLYPDVVLKPFIIYDFKNSKLLKLIYGSNLFLKGPEAMILTEEIPVENGTSYNYSNRYFSVMNYKGEEILPNQLEYEYDPLTYLKAIGIKDINEKSFQRLNNLDEKENISIVCSYENSKGLKSLWLEDYIDQPVLNCKNIILPVNDNGIIISENHEGFRIIQNLNDSIISFKNNYFDLTVRNDYSVVGIEMGTDKDENLWNSISNPAMSGSMFYKKENLLFYNLPVNMLDRISMYIEFYDYVDKYSLHHNQVLKEQTHSSGVYDLTNDSWMIKPNYDFVTKHKDYFVARFYDLDNKEITLNEIAQNPLYIFFDLKGKEIFRGNPDQVQEKFGFSITDVQILPQD